MKLQTITSVLDQKFEVSKIREDWSWAFDSLIPRDRLADGFSKNSVGLFINSGEEVSKIYTACFAGRYVLSQIEKKQQKDVLLIVKHPFDWDPKQGFIAFKDDELEIIRRFRISIYSLHTPLDRNRSESGLFSTAYAFAKAVSLRPEGEFAKEGPQNPNLKLGVHCRVMDQDLSILARTISAHLKHEVKVWSNSPSPVRRVGIVTGGGAQRELLVDAKGFGVDTFITGVTSPQISYPPSKQEITEFFDTAKRLNINVIGASHYLTEKWALELSMPYFSRLGIPAEFIEDLEALNRLE